MLIGDMRIADSCWSVNAEVLSAMYRCCVAHAGFVVWFGLFCCVAVAVAAFCLCWASAAVVSVVVSSPVHCGSGSEFIFGCSCLCVCASLQLLLSIVRYLALSLYCLLCVLKASTVLRFVSLLLSVSVV